MAIEADNVMDAGDVTFDPADRLAILNLLGAYAFTYDRVRIDEFRALFTDSPEISYAARGTVMIEGLPDVIRAAQAKQEQFKAEDNQRRHALDSVCFSSQDADEASGTCYFQVFGTREGGAPSPQMTGYYEFTAVKRDNGWKFSRWLAHIDQSTL